MSATRWSPTARTTVVGVIGDPVAHSLSPLLHNTAFAALGLDWVSVGFHVGSNRGTAAVAGMRVLGIAGLSVTMPHKESVVADCDRLSAVAARLDAVNCLVTEKTSIVGHNTDGAGLLASLARSCGFDAAGARCAVVGAGGAARAVVLALAGAGAEEVVVVNRTSENARRAAALAGAKGRVGVASDIAACDLVVNATPAGMGETALAGSTPSLHFEDLHAGQVVADLVYYPRETPLLAAAREAGATAVGGLGMLVHQAALQLAIWTHEEPPLEELWRAAEAATGE